MEDNMSWSAGSLRLTPYTTDSYAQQENRCRSAEARREEHGFRKERTTNLPECECVCIAPDLLPSAIFYTPLEDVGQFGLDKTFCVIAKRSSSYYLYRYSAENALYLFSPWSLVRRFAIRISCHRYFELFVMTTILINCVFLALSQPIEETEIVFLGIYTIEMMIKTVAKGFILNKYSYLRNPWNWLDFIVILSGYITLSLQAIGVAIGNLAGLRTFRVLRALKTVSITPGLKTIVNAMLHSLGMLAEVMTLTVFCLMVFALLALQLYVGVLRQKCVFNVEDSKDSDWRSLVTNSSHWLFDADGQPAVCGNKTGARRCPTNYTCIPGIGENPNFGYTNFDSYGWALLTTFQLITLDFWEDVYNKVNASTGPTSVFFFMLVVFFGSFYLINLTLAVVAIAYDEEAATTLKEQDKIKKFSLGFSNRLQTTINALKARTHLLKVPFVRRRRPQRWCTPRRRSPVSPPHHIPVPRCDGFGAAPPNHRFVDRRFVPGETLYEEDEDEESHAFRGNRVSHPMCLGDTPDIVISAGARLPVQGRTVRNLDNRSKSAVQMFQGGLRRGSIQESSSSFEWCKFYFGNCFRRSGRVFQVAFRFASQMRRYLAMIVNDPLFDLAITVCILLNTAFLSVEHHGMTARTERILRLGNLVFTIIFSLEAAVKLVALGRGYFSSKWNIFDVVVVIFSLLELSFETVGGFSVLRTFRLLRVVKLAQAWPTMQLLLTIIASTLGAVGNMTLVLAVIVYIFAIMGVQLFADIYTEENFAPDPVPRWNFTDFWHSLLMMFRILCGEWVQPLWDCMRAAGEKRQMCVGLFLVALTVGNFLVLNLFLAMLLNSFSTQELQEKEREKGPTDSKLLKGFRRIRRVIRRNNVSDEPDRPADSAAPPAAVQGAGVFHRRRWSEPGTVLHPTPQRRASDASVGHSDNRARGFPSTLSNFSSARFLTTSNHQLFIKTMPPLDTIKQEPQDDQTDDSSVKDEIEILNTDPEDCCPSCVFRNVNIEQRLFWRPWTWSRKVILRVVDHRAFEWIVLLLIFCSSVVLCFEDVFLPEKPRLLMILGYFNLFFTTCFVLEVLLKWMAYGFVSYFSSLWTTLDFIIVCVSVAGVVAESTGGGLYALRAIRTLRALRPLRAISRWEGMRIVVNALMSAIPSIFNVLLVCLVFWLIFGIMGVQFFGGRFYRCVAGDGLTLPPDAAPDVGRCLALNHSWINREINFDNVGNAYLALFQVATFEGWTEVMEYATDATEVGHQPVTEANFPAYIYFVTFIICGSFFTLNLFIGVIIDNFNMLKKKYEGGIVEMFLTDSQRTYYTAMLKLGRRKPQRIVTRPQNRYLRICYDVAMSRRFEMVVFLLIVLNMVAMTVEHYHQPEEITVVLETLNVVFTAIFGVEAIIKIIGLRQYYFTFPWNVFDLTVIVTSVIGIIFEEALQQLVISPTLLRVIRLIRIGRILRLIKAAKGIRKLLFALVISLPALFNIGALLFLVTFVYAIIGMSLFGNIRLPESGQSSGGGLSEMVNFQTFASSMMLLFRLTTSAGWNDVLETLMVRPPDCDPTAPNGGDCGNPSAAVVYLVTYIIINFMVVINMYIAVILENLSRASREDTGIAEEDIEMFYVCWSQFDPSATQFIGCGQLSDFVASLDPPLGIEKPNEPALVAMDLPIATGDRIHCLDILHSLVNLVLGDVEDTEEFRVVQRQIDQRFRKSFPTRNLVEIVSTTLKRKQQDNAAKVIQRTYKRHVDRLRHRQSPSGGEVTNSEVVPFADPNS